MSHHNSIQNNLPTKVNFKKKRTQNRLTLKQNIPVPIEDEALLIAGQGCLVFGIPKNGKSERATTANVVFETQEGEQVILEITTDAANFYHRKNENEKWKGFVLKNTADAVISSVDNYKHGIDANEKCLYWISIDSLNKRLRYGKGEMRLSTALLDFQYDTPKNLFNKDEVEGYRFINDLKKITASDTVELLSLWKDPLVTEPPAAVVPSSVFTMNDAAKGTYATPMSLSKECQILYGNVSDFQLNTPDFPDFEQAIEHSIHTEGCIGYRILKHKLDNSPFGEANEASKNYTAPPTDYKEVYLRITLGQSQGESPGIPYVMEIWPVGCASPVHHHGFTHAIIKVLRGDIDVDIYRMLPSSESTSNPLKTVTFKPNDVTYLMPEVNQYHLLKNNSKNTDTCITIQCYSYSQDDKTHYATFDYIENNEVGHFDPISDYDFIDFKEAVKKEWKEYLKDGFWKTYVPSSK